jgi:hypothetical protein
MVRGGSLLIMRFVRQRSRSQLLKIEKKIVSNYCSLFRSYDLDLCPTNLNIKRLPPLTIRTHMPDGERRKHFDIEVCRTEVKVTTSKNRTNI